MAYYYTVEIESNGVLTPEELTRLKQHIVDLETDWGLTKASIGRFYENDDGERALVRGR